MFGSWSIRTRTDEGYVDENFLHYTGNMVLLRTDYELINPKDLEIVPT